MKCNKILLSFVIQNGICFVTLLTYISMTLSINSSNQPEEPEIQEKVSFNKRPFLLYAVGECLTTSSANSLT